MTSILTKVTRFINDTAGLEKSMRMVQGIAQILAAYFLSVEAVRIWGLLRRQIALGRRYLRIVKFVDAFEMAFEVFRHGNGKEGELRGMVEFMKWSCLGFYLGLESLTILDAMGIYEPSWTAPVFLEAMKFWFYSLSASLLLSVLDWFAIPPEEVVKEKNEGVDDQKGEVMAERRERERKGKIAKKFVTDACDLFIPGSITGWLKLSSANVGWCCVVSTLLAGMDVWDRVQREMV